MSSWRSNLGAKLLLAHLVVITIASATLFVAALLVTPALFTHHLALSAAEGGAPIVDEHVAAAFRAAVLQSLLFAVGVGFLTALAASLYVSGRIVRPIRSMLAATRRIAAGNYAERVPDEELVADDELGQLAHSFNVMAAELETMERRRVEMLGDVAHELRTPISTLEGYLEGLLDGVVTPTPRLWARLHAEAGRLRRLVGDLQELSRAEAQQLTLAPRAVTADQITRGALDRLEARFAERGLELLVSPHGDLPPVRADLDRAVQVLTNLLTNSLRYTPVPGQVELRVSRRDTYLDFRVRDTGMGFTTDEAPRLFERFYRADKSRARSLGGAGVGLTIARALVDAMGGKIGAESPGPGRGSTFWFTLPLAR